MPKSYMFQNIGWSILGCTVLLASWVGLMPFSAYGQGGHKPYAQKELQEVKTTSNLVLDLQTIALLIQGGHTQAAAGKLTATENKLDAFVKAGKVSEESRDQLLPQIEELKASLPQ